MILSGRKRVECRFSITRRAPFGAVDRGDTLWIKTPSGPVVAQASVRRVEYEHPLTTDSIRLLADRYADAVAVDSGFFSGHSRADYATFVLLGVVTAVDDLWIAKRDRRAWVVLPDPPTGCETPTRTG